MAKIKVSKIIEETKYLEQKRKTKYVNSFPGNSGLINSDGYLSFDCIGLIKGMINDITIARKTSPVGYYCPVGKVIPDATEKGILDMCIGVSDNFKFLVPGEVLIMYKSTGHGGWYVGDYTDPSGVVNVIECTPNLSGEGGVVSSYVDANGVRWDHKGGTKYGKWEYHGKLTKYIDYAADPEPAPAPAEDYKTVDDIVKAIDKGVFGYGEAERSKKLYRYFQDKVNALYKK